MAMSLLEKAPDAQFELFDSYLTVQKNMRRTIYACHRRRRIPDAQFELLACGQRMRPPLRTTLCALFSVLDSDSTYEEKHSWQMK